MHPLTPATHKHTQKMETQTLLGSSSGSDSDQEPILVGNFTYTDGPVLDIEENSIDEQYRLQRILDGKHTDSMDNTEIESQEPMPGDDRAPTLYQRSALSTQASEQRELDDGGNVDDAASALLSLPFIAPTQAPPSPPTAPPPVNRRHHIQNPPQVPRRSISGNTFSTVFNSPPPSTTAPIVTVEKTKPTANKKKRVLQEDGSSDDDDTPISKLASRKTTDQELQQAYDTIETPVFRKKSKKKTKKPKKNDTQEGEEFTTIGKAKVRIVKIPHTEYRVSANWDPILNERELKDPMFILMKSFKDENLFGNPKER